MTWRAGRCCACRTTGSCPGLRALRDEMRALSPALVVPQIIDFLKIARRQADARVHGGRWSARDALPGVRARACPTPTFERERAALLLDPRQLRDFRYGYRQTIEDLARGRDPRASPASSRTRPRGRAPAASTASSCTSPTRTRWRRSSRSRTRGTDAYGGSFENRLRLPLEVVRAVRGAVGRDFVVGCRYLGSEDILRRGRRHRAATRSRTRCAIGVALARAGLDFLSVSRGGKFEDALQPPVGEAAYPYTGHSGHACIPRGSATRSA